MQNEINENTKKFREIFENWLNEIQNNVPNSPDELSLDDLHEMCKELELMNIINKIRREKIIHAAKSSPTAAMLQLSQRIIVQENIKEFFKAIVNMDNLTSTSLLKLKQKINAKFDVEDVRDYYSVKTQPFRGHVLILNNTFSKTRQPRLGSEQDIRRLKEVFNKLNYEVHVRTTDLKKEDLIGEIEDFAENDFHDNCDAAGVVIMSHGKENVIYDCNNVPVPVHELLNPLKGAHSKLKEKPLFVIIQACRGKLSMSPSQFDLSKLFGKSLLSADTNAAKDGETHGPQMVKRETHGPQNSSSENKIDLPDTIVLYSCLPTFKSDRHEHLGTPFIQALCEVVEKYGQNHSWQHLCVLISETDHTYQMKWSGLNSTDTSTFDFIAGLQPQYFMNLTANFFLDSTTVKK